MEDQQHLDSIIDQFSRQAIPFTRLPGHLDAMETLIEMSGVCAEDSVLDVACGPGLLACAFAGHAARVTGIDITAAMIEQARLRQREQGLQNLEWHVGNAVPLPFADGAFSLVVTRYSFHHFQEPVLAFAEMMRVCRAGGRVLVADVAVTPERSAAYDRIERLRDPSHTHALTEPEFAALFADSGLGACKYSGYPVDMELDSLIGSSFPNPGDAEVIRKMVTDDIGVNALGVNARMENGKLMYTFPIAVYVGRKEG
jgi:ubiquinone/menaquinone biosynthesis C-methylase UbiE